jgi:two-component system sensor histidine kinase BaeS
MCLCLLEHANVRPQPDAAEAGSGDGRRRRSFGVKRGLRLRLILSHVGVALLAIAIVGAGFDLAAGRRFDRYIAGVRMQRMQAVAQSVEDTYQTGASWNAPAVLAVGQAAQAVGMQVAIYDTREQIVFTAGAGSQGGAGQLALLPPDPDIYVSAMLPLTVGGARIGSALVFQPKWPLPENIALRHAVGRSLIVAALVAGLVALIASTVLTQRLTRALRRVATAAAKVTAGRRPGRLDERGSDEVAAVARAFNLLASTADRRESPAGAAGADLADEQLSLDEAGEDKRHS